MKKLVVSAIALAAVAISAVSANAGTIRLKMGDALAEDHPTSLALQHFIKEVEEKTNKSVRIKLFPNAVLGSEREVLEQIQNDAVDIARISASNLENFNSIYSAFTLPYLFESEDHFYNVLSGPIGEKIYGATLDSGFRGLTFFDSGARSFYTKDKAVNTPDDLKGQKVRVINSHTSIRMVEMMGGTPTPLAYGEIYTALQQGVIDGAENNPTALTLGRHGEVVKYYALDEHTRIPDFMIISNKAWDKLDDNQKKIVKEAARNATKYHREIWGKAIQDALVEAHDKMGVTISHPDKAPFLAKVMPIIEEYRQDPAIDELVGAILNAK
nr:TRAP transporter substrate-binding protein [uncultured Cohaesibacter sp.]